MIKTLAAALLVMTGLLYGLWPFYSADQLRQGIETGDVAILDRKVDWQSLRSSIKDGIAAGAMSNAKHDQGEFSGLAAALVPLFIDKLVDGFVNPQGLAALAKGEKPQQVGNLNSADKDIRDRVQSTRFVSPTRFEIGLGEKNDPELLIAVFEFRDFDWKLTRILFPPSIWNKAKQQSAVAN